MKATGNDGAKLLGNLLSLAVPGQPLPPVGEIASRIDNLILDSYEVQRSDAMAICGWLIIRLTMIKSRLLDEAYRAGDKRAMYLEWNESQKGFNIKAKDVDGQPVERFFPIAYGESRAQALARIANTYLASIGEIHPDDVV